MKRIYQFLLVGLLLVLAFHSVSAQDPFVSLSVPFGTTSSSFTQDFNSLPSTGNLTLRVSGASLVGTSANGIYSNQLLLQTSTGAPNVVGVVPLSGQYSFGEENSTNRALGSSSNLTNTVLNITPIRYGVLIKNTTGLPLQSLQISYTGKQWYRDGDGQAQSLTFDYVSVGSSFNVVDALLLLTGDVVTLGTNNFNSVNSLSFTSPNNVGSASVLNGNLSGNQTNPTGLITFATPLPVNSYILLRWTDRDDAEGIGDLLDTDHSLSIDDLSVTANVVNQPPVLTGTGITSPQSATVGVAYSTTTAGAFSDPDGGPLTYSASTLPSGVSIDPQTGVISGTPSTTVGSPFTVTVTATDPQGASVSTSYVLNVVPAPAVNQPPVLTGTGITSPQSATVGVAYSTTTAGAFSDPDGGPLTYSASTLPVRGKHRPPDGYHLGHAIHDGGQSFHRDGDGYRPPGGQCEHQLRAQCGTRCDQQPAPGADRYGHHQPPVGHGGSGLFDHYGGGLLRSRRWPADLLGQHPAVRGKHRPPDGYHLGHAIHDGGQPFHRDGDGYRPPGGQREHQLRAQCGTRTGCEPAPGADRHGHHQPPVGHGGSGLFDHYGGGLLRSRRWPADLLGQHPASPG